MINEAFVSKVTMATKALEVAKANPPKFDDMVPVILEEDGAPVFIGHCMGDSEWTAMDVMIGYSGVDPFAIQGKVDDWFTFEFRNAAKNSFFWVREK
jgi:hypothetical protein